LTPHPQPSAAREVSGGAPSPTAPDAPASPPAPAAPASTPTTPASTASASTAPASTASAPTTRGNLAAAWGDPLIRRLCVLAIFPFGVFVAISTFAQALLEPAGVSGTTASTILLLNVIAGVLGSATIPIFVARHKAESRLLITSLATTAAACALLAVAPSTATGYLSITLIGLLLLPALPIVLELVERRTGEAEGTAAGLIWMSGNLGGLLVATAVGLLVHHPTAAFLTMLLIHIPEPRDQARHPLPATC
ncbi:MFS transporter, partial [Kribbella solani]|uniref:MFS transporter n=1 Tax=Kribbella solani TaxID=236067 RepID=UPI0029B9AC17|nr:hypothetical protein [Kribbella solani]